MGTLPGNAPSLSYDTAVQAIHLQELSEVHLANARRPSSNHYGSSSDTLIEIFPNEITECYDLKVEQGIACATRSPNEQARIRDREPRPLAIQPSSRKARRICLMRFTIYRVNLTLILLGNLAGASTLVWTYDRPRLCTGISTAVAANLFLSIVSRNEHVVNTLFKVCCGLSKRAPLCVRKALASIFEYGGVHIGCAGAAAGWYMLYMIVDLRFHLQGQPLSMALTCITIIIAFLHFVIIAFALPCMRIRYHDLFEITHRFVGWALVGLFWLHTIMLAELTRSSDTSVESSLAQTPGFWLLILITLLLIYPWTRLRRRSVISEKLSNHALRLHFTYGKASFGQTLKIGDRPLRELHPFALIPKYGQGPGFSMIISDAGDWTRKIIDSPPSRIWTRGIPQYGVVRVASMFERVLVIATGSGIGPCLSLFIAKPELKFRILWSARDPMATYGREIVNHIYGADANAIIIDTSRESRPDLVCIGQRLYEQSGAEAAVVVSNRKVTMNIVSGLQSKKIAAYGPIFDS